MPAAARVLSWFRSRRAPSLPVPPSEFPLSEVLCGRPVQVARLLGRPMALARLRDMGVGEDRILRVEQRRADGGLVLAMAESRLALDAETAAAVRVRTEPGGAAARGRRLWDLAPGERARVVGLAAGASAYRAKLLAMGLLPGTVIELVRSAPLGDPMELRVRGYGLSLRRAEAAVLELEDLAR